jgi:signal peptidase I
MAALQILSENKRFKQFDNWISTSGISFSHHANKIIEQELECGRAVEVMIKGNSMSPSVCKGDLLTFEKINLKTIKPGSITLFLKDDELIAHRFYKYFSFKHVNYLVLKGDHFLMPVEFVHSENCIGQCSGMKKKHGRAASGKDTLLPVRMIYCILPIIYVNSWIFKLKTRSGIKSINKIFLLFLTLFMLPFSIIPWILIYVKNFLKTHDEKYE